MLELCARGAPWPPARLKQRAAPSWASSSRSRRTAGGEVWCDVDAMLEDRSLAVAWDRAGFTVWGWNSARKSEPDDPMKGAHADGQGNDRDLVLYV